MNTIVHVVISPPGTIETGLIKEAAVILNKDPYEIRLLLSGNTPKLVSHYRNIQEAGQIAERLKVLGLRAFTIDDTELHQTPSEVFTAYSLVFGEKDVTFRDRGGRVLKLESNDVFLILKGKLKTAEEKEVTRTSMKFNLTATVMTGGIPVWSKHKETTRQNSSDTELFVRIYDRLSAAPRVTFFENYFDFSCLGSKMAPSSFININTIVTELRALFPAALFDESIAQSSLAGSSPDRQPTDLDMNCKLIYLSKKGGE
jgi:hypothetical protein